MNTSIYGHRLSVVGLIKSYLKQENEKIWVKSCDIKKKVTQMNSSFAPTPD